VLAAALIAVRLTVSLTSASLVIATGVAALVTYWGMFFILWVKPDERRLIRDTARALIRR
jgi:hypothetical protein